MVTPDLRAFVAATGVVDALLRSLLASN